LTTFANRRCGDGVHVETAFEGVDEARILGEMSKHAQLDLGVVGREEAATVVGDERAAELTAVGGTHRDVLQVGCLARDAPGRGVRLLEGCVDAAVGSDEWWERVRIGRTQLLDLAVAEQHVDDRVVLRHLLQRVGVG
jgi:cobalamin biosynthesis Mg chelatase CobN